MARQADAETSWPTPAGLAPRSDNDENLQIFRRAVGINTALGGADALELGRTGATGIYKSVAAMARNRKWQFFLLNVAIYACHVTQISMGAVLTTLGPISSDHGKAITVLGAVNTLVASVLALVKGQGLPERLRKDEVEFRRLQDWIEETESLIALGVVGKDRTETGLLVEVAYKKFNAARASMQNNKPEAYVRQTPEDVGPVAASLLAAEGMRPGSAGSQGSASGNTIVRLNIPGTS